MDTLPAPAPAPAPTAAPEPSLPLSPDDLWLLPRWPGVTARTHLQRPAACTPEKVHKALQAYATSADSIDTCLSRFHIQPADYWTLINVCPTLRAAHDSARASRAPVLAESTLSIADDESRDIIEWEDAQHQTHRQSNPAAVKRDQLRISQRRWLAGLADPAYRDRPDTYVDARSVTVNATTALDPAALDAMPLDKLLQVQRAIARGAHNP